MSKVITPLLATFGLKKDYETPAGKLSVLKGVQFVLNYGEMALIFGRSGSGKSTLLHLLGGLDSVTAGKIIFEGEDLTAMEERQLAAIRNRRLGFVFQFYHLLPELTLFENVLLPARMAGRHEEEWGREILRRFKLLSRRNHFPAELSGGEKQRAAIARALVNRPALVLCDEPTGNLDEETAEEVMALINELNQKEGQSFIIVTHDERMAWHYGNTYRMHDGVLSREDGGAVRVENVP